MHSNVFAPGNFKIFILENIQRVVHLKVIKSQHRKWVIWRSAMTSSSEAWLAALLCVLNLRFLRDVIQYRASSSWGLERVTFVFPLHIMPSVGILTRGAWDLLHIHYQIIVIILLYNLNQILIHFRINWCLLVRLTSHLIPDR